MSMKDNLCDVCHTRPPIGVASTHVPFSCAYCRECAEAEADPEWVFQYLLEDVATNRDPSTIQRGLVTWKDGAFVDFHTWAEAYLQAHPTPPEPK